MCSSDHDRIFGLLSFTLKCCRDSITIDYSLGTIHVCEEALTHHYKEHIEDGYDFTRKAHFVHRHMSARSSEKLSRSRLSNVPVYECYQPCYASEVVAITTLSLGQLASLERGDLESHIEFSQEDDLQLPVREEVDETTVMNAMWAVRQADKPKIDSISTTISPTQCMDGYEDERYTKTTLFDSSERQLLAILERVLSNKTFNEDCVLFLSRGSAITNRREHNYNIHVGFAPVETRLLDTIFTFGSLLDSPTYGAVCKADPQDGSYQFFGRAGCISMQQGIESHNILRLDLQDLQILTLQ